MGWTLHMIMCVLLCYPVSIRIYYQQGVLFLVFIALIHPIQWTIALPVGATGPAKRQKKTSCM